MFDCSNDRDFIIAASHVFEEPGTLEQVAEQAGRWFVRYLN
jgi:putative phosphoribosyl transferase